MSTQPKKEILVFVLISFKELVNWKNAGKGKMGSFFSYLKRSTFVKLQKFFFSFAVLLPQ